jgi:uncharacterized protein
MTVSAALRTALIAPPTLTIALSGGIDSLTLSAAAAKVRGKQAVTLCHAVSPAVPAAATARAKQFARDSGLTLRIIDAGEFADASYRANPVNRCYFCKNNLYGSLSKLGDHVAAGTNLDDLSDYRPGLTAADEHGVLHPFVAAQMSKDDVRALARRLGLGDLAELPAAPCLASRIETGLRVEPADLAVIDAVEDRLRNALGNVTLRCRRLHAGWLIELDAAVHDAMTRVEQDDILALAQGLIPAQGKVGLRAYKRGSAFVHG